MFVVAPPAVLVNWNPSMSLLQVMRPFVALASMLAFVTPTASAQTCPSTFDGPLFKASGPPYLDFLDLAVGDFDGDGMLDVAALTDTPGWLTVYHGSGRFGLCSPVNIGIGGVGSNMVCGDMNGDGRKDLVISLGSGSITVLLNNGFGGFTTLTPVSVGAGPQTLALADFDNDGDLDVVVALSGENKLAFCRNSGNGTLTKYATLATPGNPSALQVGKLDNDSSFDVAVGCYGAAQVVQVLFGDGTGAFPTSTSIAAGQAPAALQVDDLNGDGHADLFWRAYDGYDTLQTSYGDGLGNFAAPIDSPLAFDPWRVFVLHGDIDHDNDVDLIVSGTTQPNSVLTNDGLGGFTQYHQPSVGSVFGGALADFDGDGNLDLIVGGANLQVLFGDGHGQFFPAPSTLLPHDVGFQFVAADFDGDGKLDVLSGSRNPIPLSLPLSVMLSLGDGHGGLSAPIDVPIGLSGQDANPARVDWDGIGGPDVVVGTSGGIAVLKNTGGVLSVVNTFDLSPGERRVAAANLDGDSFGDFVAINQSAHTLTLYRSNGDGTFATLQTFVLSLIPTDVAVANLNGDNSSDIVVGSRDVQATAGELTLFRSHGGGWVQQTIASTLAVRSLALADVDGDGDIDVLSSAGSFGDTTVYLNDGSAGFTTSTTTSVDAYTLAIAAVDMNGDGKADLVGFGDENNGFDVFPSKGVGGFLSGSGYFAGGQNLGLVVDLDADGYPDVVTAGFDVAANSPALRSCMNHHPIVSVYCAPKINSAGCTPEITYAGIPSASAGTGFVIGASHELPNKFGLLFYGKVGPTLSPFEGGTLCVHAPLVRLPVQNSGGSGPCGGSFALDFDVRIASGLDAALVAGQRVCGQWWSRDNGFAPPNNSNLTNAIDFVIQP